PQSLAALARADKLGLLSPVRDILTVTPSYFSFKYFSAALAIFRVKSFSLSPFATAPGSEPPCPGSRKTFLAMFFTSFRHIFHPAKQSHGRQSHGHPVQNPLNNIPWGDNKNPCRYSQCQG